MASIPGQRSRSPTPRPGILRPFSSRSLKGKRLLTETPCNGPALGVLPEIQITENVLDFLPGSQLCVFTDGLYEIVDPDKDHGSYKEFVQRMRAGVDAGRPLYESMQEWLGRARAEGRIDDDVTLLRVLSQSR